MIKAWIRNVLRVCLFLFPFSVFLVTGKTLEEKFLENQAGISEYDKIRTFITGKEQQKLDGENVVLPIIQEDLLIQENSDYAAWIYIPDTNISYPVVLPKDNQFYLKRTLQKEKNACGCLFFDAGTGSPFSAENTVIHGHNMKSGAMFGSLKQYLRKEYAEEHSNLHIYRNGNWRSYQLFSVYLVSSQDPFPYQTTFLSEEDFQEYAQKVKKRNLTEIEQNDKLGADTLVTFSTCYEKNKKLIVVWK